MKKVLALISLVLSVSLIVTSCATAAPGQFGEVQRGLHKYIAASNPSALPEAAKARKDTLVVGFSASEGAYNPIYAGSVDDDYVTRLIFEPLINNNEKGEPIPWVAKSWKMSDDKLTFTFELNQGIKFTNGEELTADDVAFTYTAICDPSYDGPRIDAVMNLQGFEEYNTGDATEVSGIKVIDKYTISFTIKEFKADAIWNFSYGIMPKSVYGCEKGKVAETMKAKFTTPVGAGPYIYKDGNPSDMVNLTRNDNYWKGTPKIKNITFKVTNADTRISDLKTGAVDIDILPAKPENIQEIKDAGFIEIQMYPANNYGYIGLNTRNPKLADKRVRQALVYGLDRDGFVQAYRKGLGKVLAAPFAPVSWAYTEDVKKYPYDPDKANQLLDEAGWKMESDGYRYKDGEKFTLNFTTYTGSKYVETLIPIMVDNYKKLGIEVLPELLEWGACTQKVYDNQDFDMYNMSWSLSIDPNPEGIFAKEQTAKGGFNSVGWAPEESVKLMKEGVSTDDINKRKEAYKKWAQLFMEECPYILLDITNDVVAVSSRVKGVNCSSFINQLYNVHLLELAE